MGTKKKDDKYTATGSHLREMLSDHRMRSISLLMMINIFALEALKFLLRVTDHKILFPAPLFLIFPVVHIAALAGIYMFIRSLPRRDPVDIIIIAAVLLILSSFLFNNVQVAYVEYIANRLGIADIVM